MYNNTIYKTLEPPRIFTAVLKGRTGTAAQSRSNLQYLVKDGKFNQQRSKAGMSMSQVQ